MARFDHPIVQEVAALGMPELHRVVINHGAAMVIRGFREERADGDIDLCVSQVNADYLEQSLGFTTIEKVVGTTRDGSEITVTVRHDSNRRFDVHVWDFSVYQYNRTGLGRLGIDDQIPLCDQDEITTMWIAGKELLLLEKRETGRPQDESDVTLLEKT